MPDKKYIENRIHGEADFPVSFFEGQFREEEEILAPLHYHPEHEFVLAPDGGVTVVVEDNRYELERGGGVFVPGLSLHAIYGEAGRRKKFTAIVFHRHFVACDSERIEKKYAYALEAGSQVLPVRLRPDESAQIGKMAEEFRLQQTGFELRLKGRMLLLLSDLIARSRQRSELPSSCHYEGVRRALAYMEEHYMEEISLRDLASAAGLSREYFCRIFSEAAKLPPVTYLNRLRVQKSMELLTATDLTIQEICGRCGFGSAAYYDRIFRRFQGQTPKEYRSGKEKSPFLS